MKTVKLRNSTIALPVGKILCLGRNYAEHAKEMNSMIPTTPIIFMKPSTALISDGEDIVKPRFSENMHYETELVVVIGTDGRDIPESVADQYVLGYGVGLDMTLRDVQNEAKALGLPWFISKGFHTSAPISEIIPASEIASYADLKIRCTVNGTQRQATTASQMIFSVPKIISYISSVIALERGDLIYTGTPEGVGTVQDGDIIEAELVDYIKTTHKVRFS
jgi:acylpyruvate hydrolase